MKTTTLYRPTGPKEMALVKESGYRTWPPRLPEQPIFYPVLTREYAAQIAREWNVKDSGIGYVTRFEVDTTFIDQYQVQIAGGSIHKEYWIPAEDLDAFNNAIVGCIEVIDVFEG